MSLDTEPTLEDIEQAAAAHLAAEGGHVEAGLDEAASAAELDEAEPERSPGRLAVAVAFPTLAAAIMVGGIFLGAGARVYAGIAGVLGVGVAFLASRLRRPALTNVVIVVGLFAIGLIAVIPTGFENVTSLQSVVSAASKASDVLRPPVPFSPGWHAIVAWLLGIVGFAAAWVALVVKKPSIALLIPIPVAAIAAVSVPKTAQVTSGIVALVLFAVGLGVLSSAQTVGEGDERPSRAYELRKLGRGLVFIAVITAALIGAAQAHFLFPKPVIDPAQQAQRPRTAPLQEVPDRVLFEVQSQLTGPWRLGSLDVYEADDGTWRLPPFNDNRLRGVPRTGIVNEALPAGVQATFTVTGLGGAVLPTLPNTVGIIARGPALSYDSRNGNIRVSQGQVTQGETYTVAAAPLPQVSDLEADTTALPSSVGQFTQIPAPPPVVVDLLAQARAKFKNQWDVFDFLRNQVLDNVTAVGQGTPVSVKPDKVQDMLAGSKQGSPFDIVAAQAMLARWAGIPSRIGYGFDGGEVVGDRLQVRPKNGASFVEVYFPRYEWLPVIGTPRHAQPTVGSNPGTQRIDTSILPSNNIAVQLFLPTVTAPKSVAGTRILQTVLFLAVVSLLVMLVYFLYPGVRKARIRSKRRRAAVEMGPAARLVLAYSEWRDLATDYGYHYASDTPLMFLDRFFEDDEHKELAWLATRAIWGDLRGRVSVDMAVVAEELSRALRRRIAQAHPGTVRFIALLSRLSLRDPFAPDLDRALAPTTTRKEPRRVPAPA